MPAAIVANMNELPEMLEIPHIQEIFRFSRQHAYNLANTEGFPAVRFGRCIRIPKAALLRWMEEQISGEEN